MKPKDDLTMDGNYEYCAFISYKHKRKDGRIANWLFRKLKHYKHPSNLESATKSKIEEIKSVFIDENGVSGGELKDKIDAALKESKYLIVICSPRSANAEWVKYEVETFINWGRIDRILPIVIKGTHPSNNPNRECFTPALNKLLEKNDIFIYNLKKRGRVYVLAKVVSELTGVDLVDTLEWQERGRRRKSFIIAMVSLCIALIGTGIGLYFFRQNKTITEQNERITIQNDEIIKKNRRLLNDSVIMAAQMDSIKNRDALIVLQQDSINNTNANLELANNDLINERNNLKQANWQMMENKARFVAEEANRLMENDSYLARLLALEVLPKDMHNPDRPYTTEAERLLREACSHNSMILNNDNFNKPNSTCSLFSPDGNFIVTSYSDGVIRIWDAKTGTPIRTPLVGHTGSINSLAFSADGKMLVSASGDNTIRIWDFDTGRQIGDPLTGHTSGVSSASFSPDGHFIVSSGEDWTIRIWDVGTGRIIVPPLEGHLWGVNCVAYSPKGKYFASVSNDKTLRIWDAEKYECIRVLHEHKGSVFKVVYSPDGSKIATASMDRTVRIWDAETFECLDTLTGHRSWAQSVAFSSDGKLLVSTDGFARIWDVEKRSYYCKPFENDFFYYAAFSPDGNRVVATATDSKVLVWDIDRDDKPQILIEGIAEPNEISYPITSLIIPEDSKHIVVEHFDETIEWDLETGEQLCQPLNGYIKSISANGKRLLLYSEKKKIARVWDTEKTTYIGGTFDAEEITLSPDGNHVVFVSKDENSNFVMKVCNIDLGTELFSINDDDNDDLCIWCISDFVFSPDGRYIFSRSIMDGVRIWDIAEKIVGVRLKGEMCYDSFNLPFFSPDGKYVIATDRGTDSIFVQIWSTETGTMIWNTTYHEDYDISISPNSKRLIVDYSNDDRIIDIVDIKDGSIIRKLKVRKDSSYTFDSKGDVLITDGSERIIVNTITGEYIKKSRGDHGDDVGNSGFIVNIEAGRLFKTIGDGFHDVAISPNEKYYAYASGANVSVRDIETGKVIKSYEGDYEDVYSVTFTPNGKKIISTYQDGAIRIWDFPPLQDLIDQTRERFKDHPLTPEERRMYYLE